jgi:tRNA G18 (ribose-2'-O)-methylase SpoU
LHDFKPDADKKYAFVFGNEVFGVNDSWIQGASGSLEIPQFWTKHSLNVSVTMGIVAWDFVSKSVL